MHSRSLPAAALVLALLSGSAQADPVNIAKPLAIYGIATSADYWSTQVALRTPGTWERNRLGPTWGPITSGAVMLTADLVLQKTGHRREARILRWVYVGACTVFVVSNLAKKNQPAMPISLDR